MKRTRPSLRARKSGRSNFVSLALNDEQKKLTGKERIEALQKLSDPRE
jgi:hypothetical protein